MSAGVAIDQPTPHQIQFLLWQDSAEVPRFMLFVLVIAVAFFLLMPQARSSPMPLLGLVGAAVGWCAVAGSAREVYLFDHAARTVRVQRISLLGRFEEFFSVEEVVAVQQAGARSSVTIAIRPRVLIKTPSTLRASAWAMGRLGASRAVT